MGIFSHSRAVFSLTSLRYVVVNFQRQRKKTPVVHKSLDPVYLAKDATFDFPIYQSVVERLGTLVELVVWDKDMLLKKDYLGEAWIPLEDWFRDGRAYAFDDMDNKVCTVS